MKIQKIISFITIAVMPIFFQLNGTRSNFIRNIAHKLLHEQGSCELQRAQTLNGDEKILISRTIFKSNPGLFLSLLSEPIYGFKDSVKCVALDANGLYAITGAGSSDGSVCLWNLESNPIYGAKLMENSSGATSIAISPDNNLAIAGFIDGSASIWQLNIAGIPGRIFNSHSDLISQVRFSSDNKFACAASWDGRISIFDLTCVPYYASTIDMCRSFSCEDLGDRVNSFAISQDCNFILAAANYANLYNLNNKKFVRLNANNEPMGKVALSPHKNIVLTCTDKTTFFWANSRKFFAYKKHNACITVAQFCPKGKFAITGDANGRVVIWDMFKLMQTQKKSSICLELGQRIRAVAFSSDCRFALVATDYSNPILINLEYMRDQSLWATAVLHGHKEAITSVAFSANGRYAITGSDDKSARIWDFNFNNLSLSEMVLISKLNNLFINKLPFDSVFQDQYFDSVYIDSTVKHKIDAYFGIN